MMVVIGSQLEKMIEPVDDMTNLKRAGSLTLLAFLAEMEETAKSRGSTTSELLTAVMTPSEGLVLNYMFALLKEQRAVMKQYALDYKIAWVDYSVCGYGDKVLIGDFVKAPQGYNGMAPNSRAGYPLELKARLDKYAFRWADVATLSVVKGAGTNPESWAFGYNSAYNPRGLLRWSLVLDQLYFADDFDSNAAHGWKVSSARGVLCSSAPY